MGVHVSLEALQSSKNQLSNPGLLVAEKAFINLRAIAEKYPDIVCIAVSHCSRKVTGDWIEVIGGLGPINLIADEPREMYTQWGLGISNAWYLLNPWTQIEAAKGPWGREMSGSRWQVGGTWGIDGNGTVRWGGMAKTADEIPALEQCIQALKIR